MRTTTLREDKWARTLAANGSIIPWQEAIISAQIQGLRISEVKVCIGDHVKRGSSTYVLIVGPDNRVHERAVTVGQRHSDHIQINRDSILAHRCRAAWPLYECVKPIYNRSSGTPQKRGAPQLQDRAKKQRKHDKINQNIRREKHKYELSEQANRT